jgi:hypothetical protein
VRRRHRFAAGNQVRSARNFCHRGKGETFLQAQPDSQALGLVDDAGRQVLLEVAGDRWCYRQGREGLKSRLPARALLINPGIARMRRWAADQQGGDSGQP